MDCWALTPNSCGPRICILNKFLDDLVDAGWGTIFGELLVYRYIDYRYIVYRYIIFYCCVTNKAVTNLAA